MRVKSSSRSAWCEEWRWIYVKEESRDCDMVS